MVRKGVIAAINDDWVEVLAWNDEGESSQKDCDTPSAGGCGACGGGHCGSLGRPFRASNPQGLALRTGDMVEIFAPPGGIIKGIFLVFVLPLALGLGGWFLTRSLGAGEGGRIGGIFLGLAAGIGINVLWGRGRKNTPLPAITGVSEDG